MTMIAVEHLRQIKTLPSLIKFLRDELDWPVETDDIDEMTFDYTLAELGLDAKYDKAVKEIKQIRRLDSKQPWGIFWVNFNKKRLPMVVLRRILGNLVIKRRASTKKADRPSWHLHDLLFISSYGEEEHRTISFAHFIEDPNTSELPVLRVLGWDDQNSIMNLDRVANKLHSHFRWPESSEDIDAWRKRWSDAFIDRYREAIRSADELIPRLAALAVAIRCRVRDVLDAETEQGPMRRLFAAVQKLLIHDMDEDGFADMYAQTVTYGLLSTRFSQPVGLTAQNLVQLTAVSNPFLENLLENLFRLNRGKFHFDIDEVGINDILDLLRNTNIEAIKAAFSDKNPAEDPVIRFYEGFLKKYDPQQRIKRGVFFTPRPVVSYIVRSVHELLQTELGLEDGLASTATWADMKKRFPELSIPKGAKPTDPFVCILDPAVGTGTFLFECIEVIERTMKDKWCRDLSRKNWEDSEIIKLWQKYVPKHLLPRLYGYELMMAPYAIAHLKLALKLGETGYQFQEGDRLHIYLTNSLEPPTQLADSRLADMFTTLASEAQEVNEIKRNRRFTVVIGNPPYAGISSNMTEHAQQLVDAYKVVDGVGLKERKLWLQDDYVKFIRIGQTTIERSGWGVLGYITNHGYLDNLTFRGMRRSLMNAFTDIYIINLHGNVKKRETSPDGSKHENVFDIQQGVAIGIFVKEENKDASIKVHYADMWGLRDAKYNALFETDVETTSWVELEPHSPDYFFVPRKEELRPEYEKGWKVTDIFPTNSNGVLTKRDNFAIDFDSQALEGKLRIFCDPKIGDDFVRQTFALKDLPNDNWSVSEARCQFQALKDWGNYLRKVSYRTFDERWIFYHHSVVARLRFEVLQHMLNQNRALICQRQTYGLDFHHIFVSDKISDHNFISNLGGCNVFPLYLYPVEEKEQPDKSGGKEGGVQAVMQTQTKLEPNLSPEFIKAVSEKLGMKFVSDGRGDLKDTLGLEDIFNYAYAVFHSPTYRSRYAEFLKIDFPRLPLTSDKELFKALAEKGAELVSLHLMESPQLDKPITKWLGATPSGEVEKVSYGDETVWINKSKTEGFKGVSETVWNFHIGGYQVCYKWLKDRKGRKLSKEDIEHYHKIVVALNETIRIMKEIDEVIAAHSGWPNTFIEKSYG